MRDERPVQQAQPLGNRLGDGGDVVDVPQGGEVGPEYTRSGAVPAVDDGVALQQIDQSGVRIGVGSARPSTKTLPPRTQTM